MRDGLNELGPVQSLHRAPLDTRREGYTTVTGHSGDGEKGKTSSLEELMGDSGFTEAERTSQPMFRKQRLLGQN